MVRPFVRFTAVACAAFGLSAVALFDASAGNFGPHGFAHGGSFNGYGRGAAFGNRGVRGRFGRYGSAYPVGAFGYPGATYYEPPTEAVGSNVNANVSINSRSVVIHRGPAFGEPGYYSQPVIYRISPDTASRPGTRRFRVDKLQF